MKFKEMNKTNKFIMLTGISVASIALLATIISAFHSPKAPDPKKLDSRTKIAYMASNEFTNLPEQEKVKYIKSVGRSRGAYRQLSSTERKAVSKNTGTIRRKIIIKQMKKHVTKFFAMNKEEQNKYLDEINARRDKWRKAREARRANNNSNTSNNRSRGNRNAWRQGFLEGMDSTTRAQFAEMRRRARERRAQNK
ncbi:MAG: hypothetical protein KOO69_08650 [Victivallales bacterium]|nr:hypothetical protein [Victivallales bacterium]